MEKSKLIYSVETYNIIGAAIEVHRQMGQGFLEQVYQEALAVELQQRGVPFEREKEITLQYKGVTLNKTYKADFVCYGRVIVELKALPELFGECRAQVINYLKGTNMLVGLLINFGAGSLEYERLFHPKANELYQ